MTRIGHDGGGFAFDNEAPAHDTLLGRFHLANRLVTQHEYLAFIRDGGYSRPELWLSQGWDRVCAEGWRAPLYWEGERDDWQVFTLHGMQELELQAPVTHVSYFEADAYARWAGPVPRESEWESAARRQPDGSPGVHANMLESGHLDTRPAPARPGWSGPAQLYGDAWEWTSSAYEAYPGFRPDSGAVGEYNGKFMCNQYVLRGGSCVTPRSHIRPATAISSRPRRAGSFPEYGWHGTPEAGLDSTRTAPADLRPWGLGRESGWHPCRFLSGLLQGQIFRARISFFVADAATRRENARARGKANEMAH